MSSSDIEAEIEKTLSKPGCLITYRLLSRRLSIHVGAAKSAMESYYIKHGKGSKGLFASYWLSGFIALTEMNGNHDAMDVDGSQDSNDVSEVQVVIVNEDQLDTTRATFVQIHSQHIYSLSTFKIEDESQLCSGWRDVRNYDKEGGGKLAKAVGKITSQDVEPILAKKAAIPSTSATGPKAQVPKATLSKPLKANETQKAVDKPQITAKKGPAKLDWSKAKAKDEAKSSKTSTTKKENSPDPSQARGTKRKSSPSQSRPMKDEPASIQEVVQPPKAEHSTSQPSSNRVAKGVILSDDEDESDIPMRQGRRKAGPSKTRPQTPDDDLRALMEMDDSEVTRVSSSAKTKHAAPAPSTSKDPQPDEEDVEMDVVETQETVTFDPIAEDSDDPAPKAKPRKRKEKKVIPIGRNGLKKKRVVKSRMDMDEKGYMVTVDYSSYESVDEDEPEEEKKPPMKKKTAKTSANLKSGGDSKATGASSMKKVEPKKQNLERSSSNAKGKASSGNQQTLGSFFGGKAKK